MRPLFLLVAYLSAGLGIVGAFLPLLPTTPFLLLALWAAARGSPALHRWLREHPRFGPPLVAWEEHRAIARPAKVLAAGLMLVSWAIMVWQTQGWLVPAVTGVLFVAVSGYLLSRPVPDLEGVPRRPSDGAAGQRSTRCGYNAASQEQNQE